MTNRIDAVPVELDRGHQLALFSDVLAVAASARTDLSVDGAAPAIRTAGAPA